MARSLRVPPALLPSNQRRVPEWCRGAGLFGVTLLAYLPALSAGFIWNDSDYVTAPPLQSFAGFWRIWFELGATEQYYPLLHSAFWLEHRWWGDAPFGYHLLNVLLHSGAAVVLAAVLRRLAVPGAWLAAFGFALHPVAVESVAWVSEQKNTLSLLFYLGAAWFFLRFDAERRARDYVAATLLFGCALLTKSVTATLPAALLVVAWWRRGRIEWRRDVRPLLPWLGLGAAMGLVSAWVERVYIGAHGAEFELDFLQRTLLAGRGAWFYAGKLLWPAELIFIYPRWTLAAAEAWQWIFPAGVVLLLGLLWRLRTWSRAPLAAALFFGGSLVPTLGFFNVYAFVFSFVADHWQYLPAIGPVALAAAGLMLGLQRVGASAGLRCGLPVVVVAALGVLTFQQCRDYADLRTFYAATLARNPAAWMAHHNLGNLLREAGELPAARAHFEAALRVRPDLFKAHNNLGSVLRDLKDLPAARAHYEQALAIKPDYHEAHNNLGSLLREQRDLPAALGHLFTAVRLEPTSGDARNNLGMALRDAGRPREALVQFERVVREQPAMAAARLNLALTLSLLGRMPEAMAHYREARRLNPALPEL